MESPQTKDWTSVPCTGRQILKHWTTREVWNFIIDFSFEIVQTIQNSHELGQGDKRGLKEIIGLRTTKPCILLAFEPHHEKQMFCESQQLFYCRKGSKLLMQPGWGFSPRAPFFSVPAFLFLFPCIISEGSLDCSFSQQGNSAATAGRQSSLAVSMYLLVKASSTVFPFTYWVANQLEATSQNHSQVLNLGTHDLPFSSTWICDFITSPQATALTNTVPTFLGVRGPVSRIFMWSTSMWQRELTAPCRQRQAAELRACVRLRHSSSHRACACLKGFKEAIKQTRNQEQGFTVSLFHPCPCFSLSIAYP